MSGETCMKSKQTHLQQNYLLKKKSFKDKTKFF